MKFDMRTPGRLACAGMLLAAAGCGSAGAPGAPIPSGNAFAAQHAAVSAGALAKAYTLTDLGTGLDGSPWLVPLAVNAQGTVVGNSSVGPLSSLPCPASLCASSTPQGWVYQGGELRQLPALGDDFESYAADVNDAGVIAGGSIGAVETAVLWNPDGSMVNLGTGIANPGSSAEADSISNSGRIAGVSYNASETIATFFDGKGGASDPCGTNVQGYFRAVNDAGKGSGDEILAAGGTAAMTCAPFAALVTPADPALLDFGFDINDEGTVVGRMTLGPDNARFHAFLYQDGIIHDLGTLFPNNPDSVSTAFAINESGVTVGFSAESGATIGNPPVPPVNPRAFVYAGGKMVDLNALLPAQFANWRLITAESISNNGYIVGTAFVGGYPNGTEHAYLLTPRR